MFFYKYVKQTLQTRTPSRSIEIQVTEQAMINLLHTLYIQYVVYAQSHITPLQKLLSPGVTEAKAGHSMIQNLKNINSFRIRWIVTTALSPDQEDL